MALVVMGALLIIVGIVMAAVRTAGRGRLSQPKTQATGQATGQPTTLEPTGEGRRLSLKADLLGLGIAALGAVLIFAGALMNGATAG
ncbi:MAG TPA: hypothetical protein VJS38_08605 [Phenylobacterium sp.]|uniref:hypothetical protein n=1 Tax=Phenylobacterium sp. TaxID=1871053 RepID=UPI002B45F20E|nr:hypothetical protein [Phenylobacterium sp.]HKR88224.1 hypothetical protein [Phenylobacterium sp.]